MKIRHPCPFIVVLVALEGIIEIVSVEETIRILICKCDPAFRKLSAVVVVILLLKFQLWIMTDGTNVDLWDVVLSLIVSFVIILSREHERLSLCGVKVACRDS